MKASPSVKKDYSERLIRVKRSALFARKDLAKALKADALKLVSSTALKVHGFKIEIEWLESLLSTFEWNKEVA